MLKRLKSFFDQHIDLAASANAPDPQHTLHLAVGALLVEMTHMDGEVWPEQREALENLVLEHCDLERSEAMELLELAEAERTESTDYFQFTSMINVAYTLEQKISLVELLWRIAYANNSLDRHEEYLVRKVADLLHVPHKEFIAAKLRVSGDR